MSSPPSDPLLTVRTAVVLLIAAAVGIAAGVLGFLAYRDVPVALLLAGGASGGARWRCFTVCSPAADEHGRRTP